MNSPKTEEVRANEAAERPQEWTAQCPVCSNEWDFDSEDEGNTAYDRWLDKLAAERRATLERIRGAVNALPYWDKRSVPGGLHVNRNEVRAILDEEAAR